jgi:hypothetical protein
VVWLKIGKLQKLLLFLILEEDKPRGKRIPIWRVVQRKFKIEYSEFSSKKQQKTFEEERKIKHAFDRLVMHGLVLPVWATRKGFSFVPLNGQACDYCILTEKGWLLVKRLKHKELLLKDMDAVRRVLARGCVFGSSSAMIEGILEFLWLDNFQEFDDREDFDRHWNKFKLGRLLKKWGVSNSRLGRLDGRRDYDLTSAKTRPNDGAI